MGYTVKINSRFGQSYTIFGSAGKIGQERNKVIFKLDTFFNYRMNEKVSSRALNKYGH